MRHGERGRGAPGGGEKEGGELRELKGEIANFLGVVNFFFFFSAARQHGSAS